MRDSDENKRVVDYTEEAELKVCAALDEMHSIVTPTEQEGLALSRAYVVMRFTETENGCAASLGMFGKDELALGVERDFIKAAKNTAKTSLSTIAAQIASQEISDHMGGIVEMAISVKHGAESFSELSPEIQAEAEKEVREEMMEKEFKEMKTEGEA